MRTSLKRLGWIGGGALLVLAGCSGTVSQRPTAAQLQEGLTLLDAKDPAWGVNAAYVKAGRAIYLESRVGYLKPEVYRIESPDEPANEMDFRFVDQNGHTFWAQRGGDSFVEPTWAAEIAASKKAHIDVTARAIDFQLAKEAAQAFVNIAPVALKDHVFHMQVHAARPLPAEDPHLIEKTARIAASNPTPATGPNGETAYGTYNYGQWNLPETDVYAKSTFVAGSHSATIMWDCIAAPGASCSWVQAIVTCNHGTCGGSMGYRCYASSGWYWNQTLNGSTTGSTTGWYDGQGGCQTGYSWSSSNNAHLCNDDTAFEIFQAKKGYQPDSIGFSVSGWPSECEGCCCGSSPTRYSCNYPNGDWNAPARANSDGSCQVPSL